MTSANFNARATVLKFVLLTGFLFLSQSTYASTIMGIVYDNQRNALPDVDVELLDDYYRSINRTRTSSNGRYEFGGLADGRYTVRVMAFRYDFMDESQLVEITTITSVPGQIGNTSITQDFYLTPRKGSLLDKELGVVFAQEVPKEAEKFYENAVKDLNRKKTDEGIAGLRQAVQLFPTYYLALNRLGTELFIKGEYGEAAQHFLKAAEINPKSPTSFYYLGNCLSKLNYYKSAIVALKQAQILAPSSTQVLFVLGKTEAGDGQYAEAEKHFLEAKKLSKEDVPDIHWELAQLYGNYLKRYKEAADELEKYLKVGKFDDQHVKQIKKIIANLRNKT